MIGNSVGISITFLAYILLMLGIGYVAWKRTSNLSDYILGGRSLGPLPSAISAGASDMSGWLLLGLPGYAYAAGYEAIWIAVGLLAGTWLNWLFVASRLRTYSLSAGDSLTLPSFFENRFNDTSRVLRVICAFFILLFFLFYTSSGLVAGGKLFETVFGLDYTVAVIVGTIAVVSYTFFGGFLAVTWTDVIQGLLMFAALLLVPIMAINADGGWAATSAAMEAKNPEFMDAFTGTDGTALGVLSILSLLGWGLGYFGQPHILVRFMAADSIKTIPNARRIGMTWMILTLAGAVAVGFLGIAYFAYHPEQAGPVSQIGERVFMELVKILFNPWVAGIILSGVLAAVMSTLSAQLLVSSSALTQDFYKAMLRKNASQTELVWVGRGMVLLIALIAIGIASNPDSKVLGLVSYAWAGFGAAFGPVVLISLLWKRMTRNGALSGMLVGAVTVVVWKEFIGLGLYEIIPGFIFASIAIYVVSKMGAEPAPSIIKRFEEADADYHAG